MREQSSSADHLRAAREQRRTARQQVKGPSSAQTVLPSPSAPMQVARCFVKARCFHDGKSDLLTLRHGFGCFWIWCGTHWREAEPHAVRAMLYDFTEHAVYLNDKLEPKEWSPNRYKISDLLEALSAIVILPDDFEQPGWLDGRETGPIVAVSNGLLDITSRELHPHTPMFFGQVSVPFEYDPDAPKPKKWDAFLNELWPHEPDAIDVLGEWYGYVISGRTDLQKIFAMIGPTRGGKGIIARILGALLGKRNVCGPTLSSLAGEFGLAPLLGKGLAVISDARSGSIKNSSPTVVERLLSISGEDVLTVNRKHKQQWNGKIPVRLHMISNELPRLGDASGAIIGRLVLLLTKRSWLGKEDHELEPGLLTELTGILNFALDGLQRLTVDNGNQFTHFAGADQAITHMRDLASPVSAFVREQCVVEADAEIDTDELYAAYKAWCVAGEYPKSPKAYFGRDLFAAYPTVRKARPRNGSTRHHVYRGIRLKTGEDEPSDELPLTGDENPDSAMTAMTTRPDQPPSGHSGHSKSRILAPSTSTSGDALDYHGPVVEVPQWPPDTIGEHGEPVANGGLSQGRIRELAHWYLDRATAQHEESETGDVSSAELDAALREVLREEVFPEFVEVAFARVMDAVFRV
jgi:putative DNA primase/helicase